MLSATIPTSSAVSPTMALSAKKPSARKDDAKTAARKDEESLGADAIHFEIVARAVAAICRDAGFDAIDAVSHRLLSHMASNFMNEICESAKRFCEHSGRTMVTLRDAQLSLQTMGVVVEEFCKMLEHLRVSPNTVLENPEARCPPAPPPLLKIGEPKPHPPHMPSFLPPFPDPHTYIRTEVSGEMESNYEKVRRIAATNKRNTENSLVSFALATRPSVSLFQELERHLVMEAKQVLEHARQMKIRKIEARRTAKNTQKLTQELASAPLNDANILMGDLLQEDANDESTIVVDDVEDDSSILKEIEEEELFELRDTEKSYIRRKIPDYCRILLPFEEERPYLSALVTDENLDDDANHYTKILSKEIEDELADTTDDFDTFSHHPNETD